MTLAAKRPLWNAGLRNNNNCTILSFRDLRRTVPNQILLNFCIALSLTLVVFLSAAERSKTFSMESCRVAAVALHYLVLVVFMWMAIEAFNMYLAFVKVLPSYIPRFILKCCFIAWGKCWCLSLKKTKQCYLQIMPSDMNKTRA